MISVPTTEVCSKAPLHFINLHRAHNAFAGMRVHCGTQEALCCSRQLQPGAPGRQQTAVHLPQAACLTAAAEPAGGRPPPAPAGSGWSVPVPAPQQQAPSWGLP